MSDERQYPITPPPEDDERFTLGLLLDVAGVLEQHGYPRPAHGRDLVDLQLSLWRYLYQPRDI